MNNNKLTIQERNVIEKMLEKHKKITKIAAKLERHRTTIKREIERNSTDANKYFAWYAQWKYDERKCSNRTRYVTENPEVIKFVKNNLKNYAPNVISGRSKLENLNTTICHESIYQIVYNDRKTDGNMYTMLPSKRKRRKTNRFKQKEVSNAENTKRSIHKQPDGAKNRSRHGHFEGDTIVGKGHKSMIFTAIDRKNKSNFTHKLIERNSEGVFNAVKLMKDYYGNNFKTLTLDNGKEFSCYERIENELNIKVYFAEPGKPQQRGSNENYNRILRRFFPKGIDFRKLSWQKVRSVMDLLNNTPRKSLGYKTPFEALGLRPFGAILIRN